ncbi:MAG TPA: response regulator [Terriglobales bacterium]|nr:response regulator [Terriglobales bacterium]
MGSRSTIEPDLLRGIQVLVVDDDAEARTLFASVLEYFGAQVVAVGSARAALTALDRVTPHAIVCDIVMPADDGFALLRALRTRTAVREVPVIALTGYSAVHAAEDALAAGFEAYLRKPVEPAELCRVVARVRRRREPS